MVITLDSVRTVAAGSISRLGWRPVSIRESVVCSFYSIFLPGLIAVILLTDEFVIRSWLKLISLASSQVHDPPRYTIPHFLPERMMVNVLSTCVQRWSKQLAHQDGQKSRNWGSKKILYFRYVWKLLLNSPFCIHKVFHHENGQWVDKMLRGQHPGSLI